MYRYTAEDAPAPGAPAAHAPFRRDGPTVLAYAAIACFAFWIYAFGPALTLLRAELGFSYTLLGVYSAVWSGGAALAGALFPLAARRVPRATLLWSSAAGAAAGAGLFALVPGTGPTLAGAAVLGLAGTTLLTVTQAVLSDRHGARRDRALAEANTGAGGCAVLAPLALGALAAGPAGWEAAFALPVVGLLALAVRYRRVTLPAPVSRHTGQGGGRLPAACWLFAGLVAAGMGAEFCLVYFGAEQLVDGGLSAPAAATAMSSFYLGILAGRVGGAVATRRPGRTVVLLHASLATTAAGFGLFWLAGDPAVAVAGLLVAGLGVANLYPLSLALTLGAAGAREDQANARTQLLGGLLVVVAPYLLGSLADRVGLTAAFAVVPALVLLCAVLLLAGLRARRGSTVAAE